MVNRTRIIRIALKLGAAPRHPSTNPEYYTYYDSDEELLDFIEKRLDEVITRKTPYNWRKVAKKGE